MCVGVLISRTWREKFSQNFTFECFFMYFCSKTLEIFSVDDFLAIYPESFFFFFPFNKMLIIHTKSIVDLLWLKFPLKFNYVPNYNMVNFLLELLVLIAPCEMLGSGAGRFCSLT